MRDLSIVGALHDRFSGHTMQLNDWWASMNKQVEKKSFEIFW